MVRSLELAIIASGNMNKIQLKNKPSHKELSFDLDRNILISIDMRNIYKYLRQVFKL